MILHVDETQYMPYETDMDAKRKAKTPEYHKCPYGCGAQWYTKAQAKKCTCQPSKAEGIKKTYKGAKAEKYKALERRLHTLERNMSWKQHNEREKQASPRQAI